MKKIYNFPQKSELPKFKVKIIALFFSAASGTEIKNLQGLEQVHSGKLREAQESIG